jgi:hypothetical protein
MNTILWHDDKGLEAVTITVLDSDSDDNDDKILAELIIHSPSVIWGSASRLRKAPNIDRHRRERRRITLVGGAH